MIDYLTQQIENELHQAKFGLWAVFHDTFATTAQEAIMAGMPMVAAKAGSLGYCRQI